MPPANPPPADDATPTEQPTPGAGGAGDVDREAVVIWSRELGEELFGHCIHRNAEVIERHMFAAVQAVAHARTRALIAERDALRAAVERAMVATDMAHSLAKNAGDEMVCHAVGGIRYALMEARALARGPAADGQG